ncbi:MIP/aquaporin family protein [Pontibacter sp. G13]|uniref:MIP/aquaporin family protein n=1 Tax=Pontibacter sp. G13 TaxID=3074898 RepID=UPI00288BABDF|nr:MIP/aquaporin family protein [Pontibacter sp. G13]WNJ16415.1 MIP/aquaporin family protein [Pontibacter sp. G13]
MSPFMAELIGTMLLILLGNGVVANVVLRNTKGNDSGWIVITAGWAMAVFVGVLVSQDYSGAHLNPAVTLGLAAAGSFPLVEVVPYILAQAAGAAIGQTLVWLSYHRHFDATDDRDAKLATFCTAPAIRNPFSNLTTEIIGTFVLVFTAMSMAAPSIEIEGIESARVGLGAIGALPVGLLVFGIGLSLGGPTGYAINPARDLVPRIMHMILPIRDKRDSDWGYSWVPVIGPILGGFLAASVYLAV